MPVNSFLQYNCTGAVFCEPRKSLRRLTACSNVRIGEFRFENMYYGKACKFHYKAYSLLELRIFLQETEAFLRCKQTLDLEKCSACSNIHVLNQHNSEKTR